jgi:hypothetical protein
LTVKALGKAKAGPAAIAPIKIAADITGKHKVSVLFSFTMDTAPSKVDRDIFALPVVVGRRNGLARPGNAAKVAYVPTKGGASPK